MPSGSDVGRIEGGRAGGLPRTCGAVALVVGFGLGFRCKFGRGDPVAVGFGLAPPVCVWSCDCG
jgi:hypothetical protein